MPHCQSTPSQEPAIERVGAGFRKRKTVASCEAICADFRKRAFTLRACKQPARRRSRPTRSHPFDGIGLMDGARADRSRLRHLRATTGPGPQALQGAGRDAGARRLSVTSHCRPPLRLRKLRGRSRRRVHPAGLDRGSKDADVPYWFLMSGLDPNYSPIRGGLCFPLEPPTTPVRRWMNDSTICSSEIRSCRARRFPASC